MAILFSGKHWWKCVISKLSQDRRKTTNLDISGQKYLKKKKKKKKRRFYPQQHFQPQRQAHGDIKL